MALVIGIDIATPGFSRSAAKAAVGALGRTAAYVAPRAATAIPAAAAYSPVATGTAIGLGALASPTGMKTVKASTSYGKKGIISSPKKAFSAVVKTASGLKRGGKVAKSGIKRKIGLAIRKIL